jgi:hypothetical protein
MQGGEPPDLAPRVTDELVIVHRGAAPERRTVGGLAERVAGEGLGLADLHPLAFVNGRDGRREMRREGPGQHRSRFGFAEPGKYHGGDPQRYAERQPIAVGVLLRHCFLQRGQRSGQVAGPGPDDASPRQGIVENGIAGSGAGQGQAVLDERQRGLRVPGPYRSRGRTEGKRRQRWVLDPPRYLHRLHRGRPRRRVVSGGGPGHRFRNKQASDEALDALFRGLAGDAGPAFWLPGQRADLREHTSHRPGEERIAGSRVLQGVLGLLLRQRKVAGQNAPYAAAPRTVARNSGGHSPIWARQASAQPRMIVGDVAAKKAKAVTIRKASGRAWPPSARAQVTAACRLSRSARIRGCHSSWAGPTSSGPARSANAA